MNSFETLPKQTRTYLLQLAKEVQGVVPIEGKTFWISTSQLDPNSRSSILINQIADWVMKGRPYLYYLRAKNKPDLALVEQAYMEARTAQKGGKGYARFNKQSEILYVGCSRDLTTRIKGHLGYGAKGTYTLKLLHWAVDLDLDLELTCAEYPQETPSEVLQALEDTLWDILKPMFGRKGQR